MTFLWRKVCRFARKPKIGVLLACAVVASSSISLALAPFAEALSSTTKNSTTFAGYVATPVGTSSESAQVSFDVPTLTCTRQPMEQDVFMFQYMEYSEGNYAEACVDAECGNGIAVYDADADACGFTGCGGCSSSSISVSPGDSVTLPRTFPVETMPPRSRGHRPLGHRRKRSLPGVRSLSHAWTRVHGDLRPGPRDEWPTGFRRFGETTSFWRLLGGK
jgi:hypothetical protein